MGVSVIEGGILQCERQFVDRPYLCLFGTYVFSTYCVQGTVPCHCEEKWFCPEKHSFGPEENLSGHAELHSLVQQRM